MSEDCVNVCYLSIFSGVLFCFDFTIIRVRVLIYHFVLGDSKIYYVHAYNAFHYFEIVCIIETHTSCLISYSILFKV